MKTALITGVAGGMGSAAAKLLRRRGWRVAGLDVRRPEDAGEIFFLQTDLTDPKAIGKASEGCRKAGLRFDAIVHMAGIYDMNSLLEMPEEDFLRIWNVNLFAAWRVTKEFYPLLRKGGRVVFTTSELAPLDPLPFTGIYGITKTAVEKLASSLRMELWLSGHPVTVIRPGAVDTGLLGDSERSLEKFVKETKLYPVNAEKFRRIVNRVESKRIPPERIAEILYEALSAARPRYVYAVNRNPGLLLLDLLPARWQTGIVGMLLKKRK